MTEQMLGNKNTYWKHVLAVANNNLWICCQDGRIWNYKNDLFSSSTQFKYEDKEILFFSLAGKSEHEIYAVGGKILTIEMG